MIIYSMIVIGLAFILLYTDKVIEYMFPKGSLAGIDGIVDDVMLHISSHEDMH